MIWRLIGALYLWLGVLHYIIANGSRPWHFMFWYPAEYYFGWKQRREERIYR